jgi:hypothetical protein
VTGRPPGSWAAGVAPGGQAASIRSDDDPGRTVLSAADEHALARLDQAYGESFDLGVDDGSWWARGIGTGITLVRRTAAGLDAALRVSRP